MIAGLPKQIDGRPSRSLVENHGLKKKQIMVSTTSMSNLNARSNSLLILKPKTIRAVRGSIQTLYGDYGPEHVAVVHHQAH